MLGQIEKAVSRGESIKSATKQAGISEQTYYQWGRLQHQHQMTATSRIWYHSNKKTSA